MTLRELYESRRLDEAWAEYGRMTGPMAAEDHLWGGMIAWRRGDLMGARMTLQRCLDHGPAGAVLGRATMAMGVVLLQVGENCTAVEYLERFLAGMDEYSELRSVATGVGHYNLAQAYRCSNRYQDALVSYEIAISQFRRENMDGYLLAALQNYAWVLCNMGDNQRAEIALADAEEFIRDDGARWQQLLGYAHADMVAGRRTEALVKCERITKSTSPVPADVMSHAYWIAGTVTMQLEQFDAAEEMQTAATNWALEAPGLNRCLQDAVNLKRSIHEARKRKQTGGAG